MNSLVTVIIPTRNYAHLIDEAIESVLNQTYNNIELIVVDDGSTDNTKEVIRKHKNVKYFYLEHVGKKTPSRASNIGIKHSRGEYIVCLGADDKLLPTYVEDCVKEIEKDTKIGFVWTGCVEFGASTSIRMPSNWHHRFSLFINPGGQLGAMLVRKKAYNVVGGYDVSLNCVEDWDMAIRLSLAGWKGKSIVRPLHLCRVHTLNIANVELRRKLRAQELEHKYWMMKPYQRVIWFFNNLILIFKLPRSFKTKLYNKIVPRLFHVPRLTFPPGNFQHTWVNEKSILKKVKGFRILDCGCGYGRWGHLLRGKQVVGIDISKPYLEEAKVFEQVVLGSATALPFQSGVFDTSLAVELIEHMSKAEGYSFLEDLKRVSAKRIILTTPRDFEPIFYGEGHPETHKSFWPRQEIVKILQNSKKSKKF